MTSNISWPNGLQGVTAGELLETPYILPTAIAIAAVIAVLFLAAPKVDPREPPLVKPRLPLVGHIIGLFKHQAEYHNILRQRTHKPIATLPMLNGKIYAVWDPILIAAGLRNKHLSTSPQVKAVTGPLLGLSKETNQGIINGPQGDQLVHDMFATFPSSFVGDNLSKMNRVALDCMAAYFGGFGGEKGETVPNVWLWIRGVMTDATGRAVFGKEDPFKKEKGLEQALWDVEHDLLKLALGVFPSLIAKSGYRARELFARVMTEYYSSNYDQDDSVSAFAKNRAATQRKYGIPDADIGRLETMLPFAAMTNTVPSLFWLFSFVMSRPDLVVQLREEVERAIAKRNGDEVVVMASPAVVEEKCPLLWSCYRETLRLTVHQISTRTVLQDTTISDGAGRGYLLKEGTAVQMATGFLGALEEYWGPNYLEFEPTRFVNYADRSRADEGPGSAKAMRVAFMPFGGGAHLCPGRMFAAAEMMAFMATMLLGYEVEPQNGKWELPPFGARSIIDAVTKPAMNGDGFGVKIKRRSDWENLRWSYEL